MSQMPQDPVFVHAHAAPQPANTLGLAGFITSVVGILFGGLLCPVGLILSLVALGRPPRGFAVAGAVIGLLGSCGGCLVGMLLLPAFVVAAVGGVTVMAAMMFALLGGTPAIARARRFLAGSLVQSVMRLPCLPSLSTCSRSLLLIGTLA